MTQVDKPDLKWWQILNMSVGFFGIQHGFEIQFARMSSIYEKLGADPQTIPMLWLAAPMTGLIIQPIIGYMSDKTWISSLKMRRRPYFLVGAILATAALCLMPNASALWMAAGLLWILDASLNISMEPFRAFVADKTNEKQRSSGFAMQTLMIGLGTILGNYIASLDFVKEMPWMKQFAPTSMHASFYVCALIYIAAIIYTVATTNEYPPPERKDSEAEGGKDGPGEALRKWFNETVDSLKSMPSVMKKLALVQFFTWMGLYCMWIFYTVAVAKYVFGATDPHSAVYDAGIRWGAYTLMVKGMATPIFALCIPFLVKKIGAVWTHMGSLIVCGLGFISIPLIADKHMLLIPMVAAGIGWAAITSLPYIILSGHIPQSRYGIYMGIFNMFIVIPEILVSVGLSTVIMGVLGNNEAMTVGFGGILIMIAAMICPLLKKDEGEAPPAAK